MPIQSHRLISVAAGHGTLGRRGQAMYVAILCHKKPEAGRMLESVLAANTLAAPCESPEEVE